MAGGPEAMYRAKENSEDDEEAARKDLEEAGMKKGDLLIPDKLLTFSPA